MDDDAERTVFVRNIHEKVTTEILEELFTQIFVFYMGTVVKTSIKESRPNPATNFINRFAFIEFHDPESVLFAVEMLDEIELYGKKIVVAPRDKTEQAEKYKLLRDQFLAIRNATPHNKRNNSSTHSAPSIRYNDSSSVNCSKSLRNYESLSRAVRSLPIFETPTNSSRNSDNSRNSLLNFSISSPPGSVDIFRGRYDTYNEKKNNHHHNFSDSTLERSQQFRSFPRTRNSSHCFPASSLLNHQSNNSNNQRDWNSGNASLPPIPPNSAHYSRNHGTKRSHYSNEGNFSEHQTPNQSYPFYKKNRNTQSK